MVALIVTVTLALVISAFCSTTEAMLYSVPWTHIEKSRESGSKTGALLYEMRMNVDKPITAVLTLNTVANTAGAAIAGAFAATALDAGNLPLFAAIFTVLVLIIGEIIPKTIGVAYATPLSTILAYPLAFLVKIFSPITWASGYITRLITPASRGPEATDDDIRVMASLSRQSGGIEAYEETAIANILALDTKHVDDIMTPRTVVFSLPASLTVKEALDNTTLWHFSRIPVYGTHNEDIIGLVQRRKIVQHREEEAEKKLAEIMEPVRFVPESETLDKLLAQFLESHQHLFAVLDEYGGLAGVVSLEDVLEEMLGREIIDETDVVPNMREVAKMRFKKQQADRESEKEPS